MLDRIKAFFEKSERSEKHAVHSKSRAPIIHSKRRRKSALSGDKPKTIGGKQLRNRLELGRTTAEHSPSSRVGLRNFKSEVTEIKRK